MAIIRFDHSLPALVELIRVEFGASTVDSAVFVRDATGYLSVVINDDIDEHRLNSLNDKALTALGGYARRDHCVRDRNGPGSVRLLESASASRVRIGEQKITFVDRRMVGAEWLLVPKSGSVIPRIAFISIKGGVGRSTALAVMAAHFSARGLRVLAIDLDLEAPGIGTMLIENDAMPKYGTLDYLIENGISGIDDDFTIDVAGKSFLGAEGGQVTVLPAFGTETLLNPAAGLGKIARAYLEDIKPGGDIITLTDQIREMIERFEATGAYDVVLVDGRAGLHETTAAVVLGIGAETLFFGINEPQTFMGYQILLSHLAAREGPEYNAWKQRIQFVNAKASADTKSQEEATKNFTDLMEAFSPEARLGLTLSADTETVTADDFDVEWINSPGDLVNDIIRDDAPVIHILNDGRYNSFDPVRQPILLTSDIFHASFDELLRWADGVVFGDQA